MKKLLFVAALGVAGLVSASELPTTNVESYTSKNENNQSFFSATKYLRGTCYIRIYRDNHDGTSTLVFAQDIVLSSYSDCLALNQAVIDLAFEEGW